jgi:ubiquinol-cytochrome c reductase cytochrome c subunit
MRNAARLATLVVALALPACAYAGGATKPYRPSVIGIEGGEEQEQRSGEELYSADCAWCHGSRGEGTDIAPDVVTGTNGPALTHFMLTTGRMPLAYPEQRMAPRDPVYDSAEIEAIVGYVTTLDERPGPPIPEVAPAAEKIPEGLELYQENCAACHSTSGIGGAMAPSRAGELREEQVEDPSTIAPDLDDSSPVEIAEAMSTGPGTMPVFGPDTFDQEQVDAIVSYVLYLQDPENPGGASIGGIGPVAEGFFGWIAGLGILLIGIRLIGTKADQ